MAGNGAWGFGGDGGPATSASLNSPLGVAVDAAGNVFIADTNNQRIRRVEAATGTITTVAGDGNRGFGGDGGPATSASLNFPYGVAVDGAGNPFIADTENGAIRAVKVQAGGGGAAPQITRASYVQPKLVIVGTDLGASDATVAINGEDVTAYRRKQRARKIVLKGTPEQLHLQAGPNQIVVTVAGRTSNIYVLNR